MTGPTPPIWATAVPSVPAIHNAPPPKVSWQGISATAIDGLRTELIGALVKLITELPTLALNLIRQLIKMIGTFEDVIFEIINAVLAWITQFPELITSVIQTVLAWITELPALAIQVINAIIGIITDVPTLITALINAAMNWISSAPDLIIQVVNTFLSLITGSSTLITTLINTAITWLTEIPSLVTTVINAFLNWIVSIPEAATAIITAISTWATEIPTFVTSLIGALLNWVRDVPALVLGVINKVIEWFANDQTGLIAVLINAMLGWITTIPELIATIITTGITWITSIPQIGTDVINALLQMITEIPNLIGAVITAALSWVTAVPEMATAIINGVIAWLTDVPGLLTTLINGLLDLVTNVPTIITNLITTAVNWITNDGSGDLASTIINAVLSWITSIPQLIENLITSVLTWISSAPTLIADVVNAALGWVTGAPALISNLITAVLGWVESAPALAGAILGAITTLIARAPSVAASLIQAVITLIMQLPSILLQITESLLNPTLWAQSLLGFGNVNSGLSIFGSGQISNNPQNLLIDGLFSSINAFLPANGWIFDPINTVGNAIGSALANVTNGVQSLIGNVIKVLTGDILNVSTQVQWNDLSGTGLLAQPPIGVNVNLYDANYNLLVSTPIAATGGAAGAPITTTSGPPGAPTSWSGLSGSLVVPAAASPAPVYAAVVAVVSDEATSGQVRFTNVQVTKSNLMPQDAVHNLPEDKQAIIDNAAGTVGATVTDIGTRLAGINPATGQIGWDYTPDVKTVNDALVNQLNGWDGAAWDHGTAAAALSGQKASTVAANTSINTMQTTIEGIRADIAALGAPARTDVFWADTFPRTDSTSLGTGWSQTYSGPGTMLLGTNGEQAAPFSLNAASRYCLAGWNGAQTVSNTDYQTIKQVLSSSPTTVPRSLAAGGYNDVIGCLNGTSDYVRFRVQAVDYTEGLRLFGTWYLDYISGGVAHTIASGSLSNLPSTMTLICGNKATSTPAYLTVMGNSTTYWAGAETNHHVGATYRGMGLGYGVQYISGADASTGGLVDSWTGNDTQAA